MPTEKTPLITTPQEGIQRALAVARTALPQDVPVGAVLVDKTGQVIAQGANRRERDHDPTAHAEILVLREAGSQQQNWRLTGTTLYITLEPCPMCAAAILQARVAHVVFGAFDPIMGAAGSQLNHFTLQNQPTVQVTGGILEEACAELLKTCFRKTSSPHHP